MLPPRTWAWASLGLALLGAKSSLVEGHHTSSTFAKETIILDPVCTSNVTVVDTTTILASTTLPVTHVVDVTVSHLVNVTVSSTETAIVSTCITESTTTTLHYTVSVTETDSATITNTETTTNTVPTTITTYTTTTQTQTVFTTSYDPCPDTCSISAATVNLFFWPSNRPYTYPSTYVDTQLAYTFTSPSVYMMIPTAKGINSAGPYGPSTTDWILPLDLYEVSTIADGSITRQLTLADLGTDCPQTAEPSAIASMVDSRCDPILAAPKQVSSWASPCNACGRFGLFDPPYAVPTVTGLIDPTTRVTVVATPTPTPAPLTGTLYLVYVLDGQPMATATIPTTGISGATTSSVVISRSDTAPAPAKSTVASTPGFASPAKSSTVPASTGSPPAPAPAPTTARTHSSTASVAPSASVVTASATRVTSGFVWVLSGMLAAYLWQ